MTRAISNVLLVLWISANRVNSLAISQSLLIQEEQGITSMVTHIDQEVSDHSLNLPTSETAQVARPTPFPSPSPSLNRRSSPMDWFHNLPVRRKQFLGLLASEFISVIGLLGVGSLLIVSGGRAQLLRQAQSEEKVLQISYNLKIDQMGFGFRGQSDNVAIIQAALLTANGQSLPPETQAQVQQILQNETVARQIEYATLVDREGRIIVNANADRRGQVFDPNGLVSNVMQNPRQIKASAIVRWDELQQESPVLPEGFQDRDALIRYTVTPVINPSDNTPIGALVSGDIVNNKLAIVENTLEAFESGYGAVYVRNPEGGFDLATSLAADETDMAKSEANVELPDTQLLEAAVLSADGSAEKRIPINGQMHATSAQVINDLNDEPVAVLVRGTSEAGLNTLILNSLRLQLLIAALAVGADVLLAMLLGRSIATPIKLLQSSTKRFTLGDRRARAEVRSKDEIGTLADTFNTLADAVTISEQKLMGEAQQQAIQAERAKALADLTVSVRQSVNPQDISNLSVDGARDILQADRVILYEFDETWQGTIVAESVGPNLPIALGDSIHDPCFSKEYVQKYQEGRVQAIADIQKAGLTQCHLEQLKPYKVRANLVVPVIVGDQLVALLIAHHCVAPRQWTDGDILILQQVAAQLGYALNQAKLFQQKEWARLAAEDLSEQQRKQKESLQMQLVDLLSDVENAASGDLTVRADVTAGDIGTVADFFNSIIENLRQIVIQVKRSANQVNYSLGDNETSIRLLADTALKQAEDTTNTLTSIDEMTRSIQAVAQRAKEAADVAHTASVTAESGGHAMDQTVNTILSLRATVGDTAKKVKRLGEASQQISKVVSLINQIAMQTNLLAINAGIEAARAGEEGQGFAVVAEEVGELAARSAAATQEIEEIVENIQIETHQVAEAMEVGTSQVVEGTQLVEKAKQSLSQIMTVSRQIDDLVGAISTATVSQVSTSESVSRLMEQIATVSEQTSQSSLRVSSSLQETVAIARELQSSVDAFTVDDSD